MKAAHLVRAMAFAPTVPVHRKRAGIAAGCDELLDAAISAVTTDRNSVRPVMDRRAVRRAARRQETLVS